ncbi:MAG: hypothetical protein HWE20_05220 [Gammaproteobacteria bacterium]|nr:hypothetical protein [Gammaproteobacteria bacterium]
MTESAAILMQPIRLMNFAGTPLTTVPGSTSTVTAALAAITAFSPTVTPSNIVAFFKQYGASLF